MKEAEEKLYTYSDLVRVAEAVRARCAKDMGTYHWNRYATAREGGSLKSPAVFTSHTHQHVEEALRSINVNEIVAEMKEANRYEE